MWNQNQNSEIYPGQVNAPSRFQNPRDGNTTLLVTSDVSDRNFVAESSRKRKAVVMNYPGNAVFGTIPQSVPINSCSNESNHQQVYGLVSSMNMQGNITKESSNLAPSLGFGVTVFQPGSYQSHGLNSSLNSRTNEKNFQSVVAEKEDNLNSSAQTHAFNQNGPSEIIKQLAGAHKHITQTEEHKHPISNQTHRSMTTVFPGRSSMDGMNFTHMNYSPTVNLSTEVSLKPSRFFSSSEVSQIINEVFSHEAGLDKRMLSKDSVYSFQMAPSGEALGVTRTTDNSIVRTSFLETSPLEGVVTEQSFQRCDSKVGVGSPNNCLTSELEVRHQNDCNYDAQIMEGKEGSKAENRNLRENVSHKTTDNLKEVLAGQGNGDYSQHVSSKLDGESNSHVDRVTPTTEKLWNGSLQLSSSVTVSAVAFFKSGEKSPEVDWSKSIVVKGKVRLEAFERYIKELPRARSRGLMVTSLCWRVGSSETGLAGMKEVAKAYKEREKVGFAQISRSIDLYVCPRSDTIITILAKYGFFKGMAALEVDQDSLIGCVVWRRNHTSSDSATKKSKNRTSPTSEKPLDSTDPVVSQIGKERFSSLVSSATPITPGNKSIEFGDVQVEVVSPEKFHLASRPVSCAQSSHLSRETETHTVESSGVEKPRSDAKLLRPVLSPQIITTNNNDDDDDDLPEFDFGTACGVSQNSVAKSLPLSTAAHVLDTAPPGMQVSADETTNVSGHMDSTVHTVQRSQAMAFQGVSGGNLSNNPANKFGERDTMAVFDEEPVSHCNKRLGQPGNANPTTRKALPEQKSLWDDDDDDMPEWCPPDLKQQCRPSIPCAPSPVPNVNSELKLPGPPPLMTAAIPSSSYIPSLVPSRNSENVLPGPPPRMPASGINVPPGPPPKRIILRPPSSFKPPPVPPPTLSTSRPSFSYMASPVPNKSENRLPPPPPLPLRPPPLTSTPPQFHTQGLFQVRPVGANTAMGFTFNPTSKPLADMFDMTPSTRSADSKGWRP